MRLAVLLALAAACGGPQRAAAPGDTTGAIGGLARDHDSGDPVAKADIRIRAQGQIKPLVTTSSDRGIYGVDHLPPGKYSLTALFAGQPVDVENIDVRAGEATIVDIVFTLGHPDPIHVDFGDPKPAEIDRYRPPHLPATAAIIEGTINDKSTKERIPGAVVTAVLAGQREAAQTVSDDQGRYRFESLAPGTYSVSTYYSVDGHAQIEVRRSGISVGGSEAVVVPLLIESTR